MSNHFYKTINTIVLYEVIKMPAFTSGPILNPNDQGRFATVLISNDDPAATATIELELFVIQSLGPTGVTKTPVTHTLFTVAPLTVVSRTISIQGFPAYEAQYNSTGTTNVVVDAFTVDAAGLLVAAQRVLQAERTPITTITPAP
jgi:hypothetical protein